MTDLAESYVGALAIFGEQVRDIAEHEWDLPTPCTDWDVRQVVAHVILGDAQFTGMVRGEDHFENEVDASIVGVAPMSVWRGTALAAIEAARTPEVIDRRFEHPSGAIDGAALLGWRISENLVHAWDLSVAVGRPRPVDDDLAEACLAFWWPVAMELGTSGEYAPAGEPPAGASAGVRLLFLLGRTSA